MNLLKNVNHDCRKILIDHASKFGQKSAFTDDAFTSKKIIPSFKPHLSSARWTRWQTVTHESFKFMLVHVIQKHETTHEQARAKASKVFLERAGELSALVWGLREDACAMYPSISEQDIKEGL